jgi:O-antigen ligase
VLVGWFCAQYIAAHTIYSILKINVNFLHYSAVGFLIIIYLYRLYNKIIFNNKILVKNKYHLLIYIIFVLYALMTAFVNPSFSSFRGLVEIVLISLFFFIGKNFNFQSYKVFFVSIAVFTTAQAIILNIDRSLVYDGLNDNYLLVTLILGVVTCNLYILIFQAKKFSLKLLFLILLITHVMAILNMQSRGTAIFVLLFVIFYPAFYLKIHNYMLFIFVVFAIGLVAQNQITFLYNDSVISTRMNYLVNNIGNESRLVLFSHYLVGMKYMWITGFGTGQSSMGIYGYANEYPHNLLLEFISEFGIVGAVFIIYVIFNTVVRFKNYTRDNIIIYQFSITFLIYMFFMFSKSSSIYDSYPLFLSFGFMWSFANRFSGKIGQLNA